MKTHKKLSARILSMALTVAMVATMMPSTVFAAEGDAPLGASSLGTSSIGTIRSFEKLEDRFEPSTGEGASKDVYALNVELNTPFEDVNLPDELTAMVARTTTVSTPSDSDAEDEPVVDSGEPSEPAEDEVIPDEDEVVDEDNDDTVSGNQPASPSDAKEEIKDEDVPLSPEPEQSEENVTITELETIPVTWKSDKEYRSDENGRFVYTSVLPEGYILADGVKLPQIYVLVGEQEQSICADTAESNALLDRLLALTAEQQVMIDEGGADVTSTDRFKALAVEIDELYAHVDVCGICAAQMAEGGAYYEKFYPAQTMEAGNVVAKIGENTYTSLQDAFTAVADGETIIIQQAITQNTSISKIISDSVVDFTLDLNGFDVTITANNVAPYHAINLQGKNANERSSMTITDLGGNSTLGKLTVSGALGTKTGEGSGIQGNNFNIIISKIEVGATGTILDAGAINGNITINEGAIVSAKGRVGMLGTKLIIDGATVTAEGIDNNKSNTAGITFTDVKIIDSDVTAIATGSAEILSIGIQASGSLEIINSTVNITATSPKASTGINLMGTNNSITNSTVNINSGSNGVAMTKGPVLDVTTGQNLGAWYSDKVTYAPLNGDTGYTVTFDAGTNGSTILSGSTGKRVAVLNNVKNGTTFAVPPKNPTNLNSSRTFEGWFTSADAGITLNNTAWNFDTDTVTADMTLYAKWSGTGIDAEKPVITSDLSTTAVTYSQNASTYPLKIVASVTDGGTLSYQWYSNSANNTTSGSIISGATNDTFSPPTTTTATTYYYCIVTNTISNSSGGQETNSTTSKIALIIVDGKENAVPPLIGDNLSTTEVTYVVGATASPLSITASTIDSGTISYQWYKSTINNTSTNASVATAIGTNANTYTPPTTTAGTLYYFCYVTNTITDNSDGGLKTISIPSKIAKITVDATFVPVTNITGVPTTATAGTALSLTGTVAPTTATNKTIVWSVKSAGTTGATISGSTLNTTAAGTVTVTATITNGLTASSNYTKDFTITVNAAASGGEQFNFPLGGTYYFDLSGEAGTITSGVSDKMGTINTSLPDATMHYVPFTYVGTVNVYSLDSSSSGQTGASAAATASNRSLFVADYNVSTTISWDSLNTNGLVFGNTFDTNYKLRSLSVGSSEVNSKGSPSTNEWDTILDKTAVTNPIKNWTGIYSWGQDTYSGDTAIRAARGHNTSARKWGRSPSTAPAAVIGYRPALEVLNVDSLNAVELDWNGGKFNNSTDSIKIVCAGGTFIAPGSTGLTAPTDKTAKATFWNTAADGSGTGYAAGASVPNTVTKLYTQWEDEAATFVPVTGITGVPTTATTGTALSLTGTVAPANATNKTIVWNVKSAGTTGATISGSTLNTTAAGTVTVTATITNGLTASSNYTKDFTITVNAAFVPVTDITGVPTTATAGTALSLTGTVAPATATNKTIEWSVKSAGTTGATISGSTLNTTAAGTVTVTATITNGLTASSNYTKDFTITVSAPKTLSSIAVTTPPAKTAYTVGQTFDKSGMIVTATYTDNTTAAVSGYTFSPTTALAKADTTITISYTENGTTVTATQAITVTDVTTHNITASAGTGGSISPSGAVTVNNGESKTFTISANSNYSIASVTVDGVSQGAISTYTFSNVTGNHTISAAFRYNGGGGGSSSSQTIYTSVPPKYTGGTKIIGNVRVPDYTVEGTWKKSANGTWNFSGKAGKAYANSWAPVFNPYADVTKGQSAFDWFKFDASGNMITGWHTDTDGNTYYLNPTSDNTLGAMKTGWVLIDGKYYYFNEMPDGTRGKLFQNTRTPDGYLVDQNGVWDGNKKQ